MGLGDVVNTNNSSIGVDSSAQVTIVGYGDQLTDPFGDLNDGEVIVLDGGEGAIGSVYTGDGETLDLDLISGGTGNVTVSNQPKTPDAELAAEEYSLGDQALSQIATAAFGNGALGSIVYGSAVRAIGQALLKNQIYGTALTADNVFNLFVVDAVGSLGGFAGREVAQALSNSLGLPADVSAAVSLFASQIGTAELQMAAAHYLDSVLAENDPLRLAADQAVLHNDPSQLFQNAAISAISSFAADKLGELIGLDPKYAPLVTTPARIAIQKVVSNLAAGKTGADVFSGFKAHDFDALGSVAATILADDIGKWDSSGEILGSNIGDAIGGFIGQALIPIPIIGEFIGAFLGDLIGGLLGGLIGGATPEAFAYLAYDSATGQMAITKVTAEAGGSKSLVKELAGAVRDNVNTVIASVGGDVLATKPDPVAYGYRAEDGQINDPTMAQQTFGQDYNTLVEDGIIEQLESLSIANGDVYAKRAFYTGLAQARDSSGAIIKGSSATIISDLTIASAFETYLANTQAINAVIATDPNGNEALGWEIVLEQAYALGLQRRNAVDWIGGWKAKLSDWGVRAQDVTFEYNGGRQYVYEKNGATVTVGDDVPANSQDIVAGTSSADRIVLGSEDYLGQKTTTLSTSQLVTFDALHFTGDMQINVTAEVQAGDGHDQVIGGDLGSTVFGGAGDDLLQGGKQADWLFGGSGDDQLLGLDGSGDYLDGGSGDDRLHGDGGGDWLAGGAGNDILFGGAGDDTLDGGAGDDTLDGGAGSDTYIHRAGDGMTRIVDAGGASDINTLILSGVDPDQVVVRRSSSGDDLLISLTSAPGDVIEILGQALAEHAGVDAIQFDDGTVWSRSQLLAAAGAPAGAVTASSGNGTLSVSGGLGDDALTAAVNLSTLSGGYGSDTYVVAAGVGNVTINDIGAFGDFDRLQLTGIASGNVTVSRALSDPGTVTLTSTDGDVITLQSEDGLDSGVDAVSFSDGATWSKADLEAQILAASNTSGADVAIGSAGAEVITTGAGNDILAGGRGDDTLIGGDGSDTYRFNLGDGHDRIFDTSLVSGTDTLAFGAGISATDVYVTVSPSDWNTLVLSIPGSDDQITLVNQIADNGLTDGVEQVTFADGTVWTRAQLAALAVKEDGTPGDDVITGTIGADTLVGGAGDDDLSGRKGPDTYIYNKGDGYDVITDDIFYSTDVNTLQLGSGITTADIAFERGGLNNNDIILHIKGSSDAVDLVSQSYPYEGVQQVVFADGTTWTAAQLMTMSIGAEETAGNDVVLGGGGDDVLGGGAGDDTLYGGGGDDIYHFNLGDGFDQVVEYANGGVDQLVFGAGITASQVVVTQAFDDRAGYLLTVDGADQVIANDQLESIVFADGTTWTQGDLASRSLSQANTAGDKRIYGTGANDTMSGGSGDFLSGGDGSDTYLFNLGDGQETIGDISPNQPNFLQFGAGIDSGDITVSRPNGSDFLLRINGTNDSVYLEDVTAYLWFPDWMGVGHINFADGTTWTIADMFSAYVTQAAANGTHTIYGTGGGDTLWSGTGDDYLSGGGGSDTYLFNKGDGADVIDDGLGTAYDTDTLQFGDGIATTDLIISRPVSGDYLVRIKGTNDSVYLKNEDGPYQGVEVFKFADGTVWSYQDLANAYLAQHETAGDDHILGSFRADTIQGGPGNDFLDGGGSADTYLFNLGDGHDTISDSSYITGEQNKLVFGDGILASDVIVTRPNEHDVLLTINGRPDSVYLVNETTQPSGVAEVDFADGTVWTRADLFTLAATTTSAGATIIRGTSAADVLTGGTEADELVGGPGPDALRGGGGADIYLFNAGDGSDAIQDYGDAASVDQLQFGAGVIASDIQISVSASDANDLVLSIRGTDDAIYLDNETAGDGSGVEQVVFADGTVWTRSDLTPTALAAQATSGNDTVYGTVGADTLAGGAGDDLLEGGVGSDIYQFNVGDGHDTVYDPGGAGEVNELDFGAGITSSDIVLSRSVSSPNDLLITIGAASAGDSVLLKDEEGVAGGRISQIRFADGQALDHAALQALYLAQAPASGGSVIIGYGATEALTGGAGDDTVVGGEGADTFTYNLGGGNDVIRDTGSAANLDTLALGAGIDAADVVVAQADGGDVNDWVLTFNGHAGSVDVTVGDGQSANAIDKVTFADGTIWTVADLRARYFSDTATDGPDNLVGTDADDTISGLGGDDTISGGAGNDTIYGGDGNDFICGGDGNDHLDGGAGDDTLIGGLGSDTFVGGAGTDTADFTYSNADWTIDLSAGTAATEDSSETLSSIENIVTGGGADILTGDGGANVLTSGAGDDTLSGGGGDDVLDGGAGADQIDGGAGVNTVTYASASAAVTVTLSGSATGGDAEGDVLTNIQNLTGSAFADTLTGDANANVLNGGAGNDQLFGAGGADTLQGGAGDDALQGGAGDDTYVYNANDGADRIVEVSGAGADTLVLSEGLTTDAITVVRGGASRNDAVLTFSGSMGSITLVDEFTDGLEVEQVVFADGTVWTEADLLRKTYILGTTGADSLSGTSGGDVFDGLGGGDYVNGHGGGDAFIYNAGYGSLAIDESDGASTPNNVLRLGAGIVAADLHATSNGSDLYLTDGVSGDLITLYREMNLGGDGVQAVELADGTTLTRQQLIALEETGTTGSDSLFGTSFADTIDGHGGGDYVNGRGGGDTFVYNAGYGALTIDEYDGASTPSNVLQLGAGIVAADLRATSNGADIFLTDGVSGDRIQLERELNATTGGVQTVELADGTTLTRQQLIAMEDTGTTGADGIFGTSAAETFDGLGGGDYVNGGGGGDAFVYNSGYGALTIDEYDGATTPNNVLQLGAGIVAADLHATSNSVDIFLTDGVSGDLIQLERELNSTSGGVQTVELADGTTLTRQQLIAMEETGTTGSESIWGTSGADTLDGHGGGDYINGGGGGDAFVYNSGYGALEIAEYDAASGAHNVLQFGSGILASGVTVSSNSSGDILLALGNGDDIRLDGEFSSPSRGVQSVTFADGTVWNRSALLAKTGDAIVLQRGDGAVSRDMTGSAGGQTLLLGDGIAQSDVIVQSASDSTLIVRIRGTSDSYTFENDLSHQWWGVQSLLQSLAFSDGSTITFGNSGPTFTWIGDASHTTLTGANIGANVFELGAGGDSITAGNNSDGGTGVNTFDFDKGDGAAVVNMNGGTGVLVLASDIVSSDVILQSNSAGDLIVRLRDSDDSITFDATLSHQWWGMQSLISAIDFADGTALTIAPSGQAPTFTWIADADHTVLTGGNLGSNVFKMGPGGDTITAGNTSAGGPGTNTFDFGLGDGAASVNMNGGTGTLVLGAGIAQSDLILQTNASGDLIVRVLGGDDSITFQAALSQGWWGLQSLVPSIHFADGTSMAIGSGASPDFTWIADADHTTLTGSNLGSNTFDLAPGGDTIVAGNQGNTFEFDAGDGQASVTLNGGSASLVMAAGITADDIILQADNADKLTVILKDTGDSIVFHNDLSWWGGIQSVLHTISFTDGTVETIGSGSGQLGTFTWIGTSTTTTLVGSNYGPNVFDLGPGGDTITAGSGAGADNTFLFDEGDGYATITLNSGTAKIEMASGITADDVIIQAGGDNALTVILRDTGDSIKFYNDLWWNGSMQSVMNTIDFADGTSETIGGSGLNTSTWIGTSTNTTLTGTNYGPNVFELGAGGDTVTAGNGANTFDFSEGIGHATVTLNSGTSKIEMASGITAADVIIQAGNDNALTVILKDTGDSITFYNDLWWTGVMSSVVNTIDFADGTSEAIGGSSGLNTSTWLGDATHTTFTGSNYGPNVYDLGPGGDTITAGSGAGANNTFLFDEGDGHATVTLNSGTAKIEMASGITANDVIFQAGGDNALTVILKDTGDSIKFYNDLWWTGSMQSVMNTIDFADGTSETIGGSGLNTSTWIGTSTNTALTGTNYGPNIFDLGPGDDVVTGGNNANTIEFGVSVGNATINISSGGGSAANLLDFGSSLSDEDLWFEHDGNNLRIDVVGTDSNVTINDWYSGGSHQLSAITAGGLEIDSQVASLVSAMATFQSANPGFDPSSATVMPTDTGLQTAIAAAWHT
jgi:Ca2+-binding RTX toxin-like protein